MEWTFKFKVKRIIFLVIKSIGGHPWKLFIFNYYIKFIYFKVKEKLHQEKNIIFQGEGLKISEEVG